MDSIQPAKRPTPVAKDLHGHRNPSVVELPPGQTSGGSREESDRVASPRLPESVDMRERVIEAGLASFPASDPPGWWAGP
jgi:hypothetical protein